MMRLAVGEEALRDRGWPWKKAAGEEEAWS